MSHYNNADAAAADDDDGDDDDHVFFFQSTPHPPSYGWPFHPEGPGGCGNPLSATGAGGKGVKGRGLSLCQSPIVPAASYSPFVWTKLGSPK